MTTIRKAATVLALATSLLSVSAMVHAETANGGGQSTSSTSTGVAGSTMGTTGNQATTNDYRSVIDRMTPGGNGTTGTGTGYDNTYNAYGVNANNETTTNRSMNWGWLGLLGLVGLAGIGRKNNQSSNVMNQP